MAKKETADTVGKKKGKKPTYGQGNKSWKFFDIGEPDYLVYSMYSKGDALGVPNLDVTPLLVEQEPFITASYKGKGTKFGNITSFKVVRDSFAIAKAAKTHKKSFQIIPVSNQSSTIDKAFNIAATIRSPVRSDLEDSIKNMLRGDVAQHCVVPAIQRLPLLEHYKVVDAILPKPTFTTSSPAEILIKGKGEYEKICWLDWGFDVSQNCFATMLPDGRYSREGRCTYCYAEYMNGKPVTSGLKNISRKNFRKELREKLEGDGPHFIRSGQRVENLIPASMKVWPGFVDNLPIVLEEIIRAKHEGKKIAVAFPTKVVEYDEKLAQLFIDANVTLLGSIGYEALEENVVRMGATTQARLDGLLQYARAGVRAAPYVLTDVTRSMEYLQDEAKLAIDFYKAHRAELAGLQFLDARITKKKDAPIIAGNEWEDLKTSKTGQLNFFTTPRYHLTGNGHLAANVVHQEFLDLVGNNREGFRLCYTHSKEKKNKCGACFMEATRKEFI
ncbi:hypothetical protein K9M74_00170 [Candidatus Woesearchaeota archaeon]|nr:hypothetical protein [Candidatus Woesearchaeota archaeon]